MQEPKRRKHGSGSTSVNPNATHISKKTAAQTRTHAKPLARKENERQKSKHSSRRSSVAKASNLQSCKCYENFNFNLNSKRRNARRQWLLV
jgi:hypothetical protein